MKKALKALYLGLGFLCFGLGALGAALPILPTTPFLLLASFFLAKGSDRFHTWFQQTGLYSRYLEHFVQTKSMTARSKALLLGSVSLMLLIPFCLTENLWARGGIGAVVALKYYYFLFRVKTAPSAGKKGVPSIRNS